MTTDRVADALLDFLVTLPRTGPPERIAIPVLRGGRTVGVQLLVTAATPFVVFEADAPETPLDGEEHAVAVLRHRAARLDSVGFGLAR